MDIHPHQDILFAADAFNDRMLSFRRDGTIVKQWGSKGAGDGQFNYPYSVAILAQPQDKSLAPSPDRILGQPQDRGLQKHPSRDCIFVADVYNHRIQVFGLDGSFIRKWGSNGRENGQFKLPVGIAVLVRSQDRGHLSQDLVYVTELDNHRVQVFGSDGNFIRKWGTRGSDDGQFNAPHGVAVHPTRDLVFISDLNGNRIQAFRSDGTFLYQWGSKGSADGQFQHPQALSLHPGRNLLFVADMGNFRVQVFDLDGAFVCKWGVKGRGGGEFVHPMGISVNPSADMVYVGDLHCIQVFSLFPTSRKRKYIDG